MEGNFLSASHELETREPLQYPSTHLVPRDINRCITNPHSFSYLAVNEKSMAEAKDYVGILKPNKTCLLRSHDNSPSREHICHDKVLGLMTNASRQTPHSKDHRDL